MKLTVKLDAKLQKCLPANKAQEPTRMLLPLLLGRYILYGETPIAVLREIQHPEPAKALALFIKLGAMTGTVENPQFNPRLKALALPPSCPATPFLSSGNTKVAERGKNEAKTAPVKTVTKASLIGLYIALLKKNKADKTALNSRKKGIVMRYLLRNRTPEAVAELLNAFFIKNSRTRQYSTDALMQFANANKV